MAHKLLIQAEKWPLLTIAVFLLFALGPFLNKAVHIDDSLFVWTAEQILKHPGDFYGFDVNWTGYSVPMNVENCNPPAQSYFLSGVMAVFGEKEIFLHSAMLLVAFAAATAIFQLAKMWSDRPLLATLIAMTTPVFFVSATTLMCDMPMLAVWMWAIVFWERALKNGRAANYLFATLLAGICVLVKYSALTLLPLLPILGLLRKKNLGVWLLWLAVPAVMIELYQFGTGRLYGHGLITAAANYASQSRWVVTGGWTNNILIGLAYLGGCLLSVLFFVNRLWSKRELLFGGCAVLATALAITFWGNTGRSLGLPFQLQMALFVTCGIHILVLALVELLRRRDAISLTLILWIGSEFAFAAVLNWTVSARSFLPLVPAVAILAVRVLSGNLAGNEIPIRLLPPLAIAFAISVTIAIADLMLANSGREAAQAIAARSDLFSQKLWFQGHRGFQYYLQKYGALPVDFSASVLRPGDILIIPSNGNTLVAPSEEDFEPMDGLECRSFPWLTTVHWSTGAGFYGAGGLLPFVFGTAPKEYYYVWRTTKTTSFAPPEILNNLAWQWTINSDPQVRNGIEAMQLAQKACELTKYERPLFIGTLAAAQAEAGKFDDAIISAQRACAVAEKNGETNVLQRNRELLELYRAHKTAREQN
jgi:4-amino-4-deoxy-L-arabinose transferase-like glycosyltransferase